MDALPVTGNTTETQPENRAFYPGLDGLRAIAFLAVFYYHYCSLPWGFEGVDVFFVLSGFLITGILFDTRDKPHHARTFYIRRTLRIFPLYYGVMLGLILLKPIIHWEWSWAWLSWPLYLGNLWPYVIHRSMAPHKLMSLLMFEISSPSFQHPSFSLSHFWTLCVEEQFYLFWPWVVYNVRSRGKLMLICALSLPVCLFARIWGIAHLSQWLILNAAVYRATPFRVDDLLFGGLIALLLRGAFAPTLLRWSRLLAPIVFVLFVLLLLETPQRHMFAHPYPYPSYDALMNWILPLIAGLTGLVILLAIQPQSWVARVLSARPLRWLGRISYGAYVFHAIFINYFRVWAMKLVPAHPEACASTIGLISTILLAWLSFRYFELRFLRLKERWT